MYNTRIIHKFIVAITLLSLSLATAQASPATRLIKRLKKIERAGIMLGHQDDPVYGHNWKWERGKSDVKDVTGDYPALMGFELGDIELGHDRSLDKVPFDRIRQEIIAQDERGGIIEISWHANNPATGKNAWDPSGNAVKEVLPGGRLNNKFNNWLDKVANFLLSIKDKKGNLIPVIFRPWHEMGGGWFWWGKGNCTPDEYKQLYIYTFDTFTKKYKLNNLVWGYSPNTGDEDILIYYPGDKYVDLIGFDFYDFDGDNDKYRTGLDKELDRLVKTCAEHKKIAAITETGAQRLPDKDWFTKVFWPVAQKHKISYALFWRNAWDDHKETYLPYPGAASEQDFKKFVAEDRVLLLKDIKNIK